MSDESWETSAAVVVISYGHSVEDVNAALASALSLRKTGRRIEAIVLDDQSGRAPTDKSFQTFVTPHQAGYAAAMNHAVGLFSRCSRIVFVNPDAVVHEAVLRELCWPANEDGAIIVPSIVSGESLENVRSILEPGEALRQLISPRFGQQRLLSLQPSVFTSILGRPWVPSGAIASFATASLIDTPMDPRMFWVEMSDWARRSPECLVRVLPDLADHRGHSSKEHASLVVFGSEMIARISYIRRHGSMLQRALVYPCALSGIGIGALRRAFSAREAFELVAVALGRSSWQKLA